MDSSGSREKLKWELILEMTMCLLAGRIANSLVVIVSFHLDGHDDTGKQLQCSAKHEGATRAHPDN